MHTINVEIIQVMYFLPTIVFHEFGSIFFTEMAKSKSKNRNSRTRLKPPRPTSKPNPFEILAIKGIEFVLLLRLLTFHLVRF